MRYLLIGYGNIGKKRKDFLGDKCIAIADPYKDEADYRNYKDVPLSIFNAAIVSTPNSVKLDILEYLLTNKKHVLIEKPLFFNDCETAKRFEQLAKNNSVIWYTSYNHRFEPLIVKLKEYLNDNLIGELYFSNFIYGNGTVQNSIGTWRDKGYGVLEDLGCHLIDMAFYLFPDYQKKFKLITAKNFEAKALDFCTFSTADDKMNFLCSYLMWKNTFRIDVFGSKGSLHLNGLNKWGGSRLIYRERIFPSGIPNEKIDTTDGSDHTWKEDIKHFEKNISKGKTSYKNDEYIFESLKKIFNQYGGENV